MNKAMIVNEFSLELQNWINSNYENFIQELKRNIRVNDIADTLNLDKRSDFPYELDQAINKLNSKYIEQVTDLIQIAELKMKSDIDYNQSINILEYGEEIKNSIKTRINEVTNNEFNNMEIRIQESLSRFVPRSEIVKIQGFVRDQLDAYNNYIINETNNRIDDKIKEMKSAFDDELSTRINEKEDNSELKDNIENSDISLENKEASTINTINTVGTLNKSEEKKKKTVFDLKIEKIYLTNMDLINTNEEINKAFGNYVNFMNELKIKYNSLSDLTEKEKRELMEIENRFDELVLSQSWDNKEKPKNQII